MKKQGVLLVNLGSPEAPEIGAVRRYLREFLMDRHVLDIPWLARFCLVHFIILPRRPKISAEAYRRIWRPEGSPLIVLSRKIQQALRRDLDLLTELAMRYQHPAISEGIGSLTRQGVDEIILAPLYPHYAASTWLTVMEEVKAVCARQAGGASLKAIKPFYNDTAYVEALVASASDFLKQDYDYLLFSYHGLPERHLRRADPTGSHCLKVENCCQIAHPAHQTCYRAQVLETLRLFIARAGIPEGKYGYAFQSRLGRDPWLRPYTDAILAELPSRGVKRLLVICPAFITDCLETIEEIGMRGRDLFERSGGRELRLIPCLNDHPLWIEALSRLIQRATRG